MIFSLCLQSKFGQSDALYIRSFDLYSSQDERDPFYSYDSKKPSDMGFSELLKYSTKVGNTHKITLYYEVTKALVDPSIRIIIKDETTNFKNQYIFHQHITNKFDPATSRNYQHILNPQINIETESNDYNSVLGLASMLIRTIQLILSFCIHLISIAI